MTSLGFSFSLDSQYNVLNGHCCGPLLFYRISMAVVQQRPTARVEAYRDYHFYMGAGNAGGCAYAKGEVSLIYYLERLIKHKYFCGQ